MKMDKNADADGEEPPPRSDDANPRRNLADALDEILEAFASRTPDGPRTANGHPEAPVAPSPPSGPSSGGVVDGIDPSSPLGRSLLIKFSELEEISRRLKSRLNRVVRDRILLSPDADANGLDFDLERDLNTDSHAEDLTPQEFLQLIRSQTDGGNPDGPEKSDEASE